MFTPQEFSKKFAEKDEMFYAKYTGLIDKCIEEALENPNTYIEWKTERRISIPIQLDENGEEELFRGFNLIAKKRILEFLSRKLEREFEEQGWEARVSAVWLELKPRRKRKHEDSKKRSPFSVITGGKG